MPVEKIIIVTLACCVLHNYCEIEHERLSVLANYRIQNDPYVGFHVGMMRLPREGEVAKIAGGEMKDVLFASWLEKNPDYSYSLWITLMHIVVIYMYYHCLAINFYLL